MFKEVFSRRWREGRHRTAGFREGDFLRDYSALWDTFQRGAIGSWKLGKGFWALLDIKPEDSR